MIPILISGRKYKIKSIPELTTAEFIELSKIQEPDFVKYISWQTKLSMEDCFFTITSKAVEEAIGKMPDITKLPYPKHRKDLPQSKTIETVGQRYQVEGCGLHAFELLVFVLAVAQARSNNIDDVHRLRDQYLQQPFTEILPAGFFFIQMLRSGKRSGVSYLWRLAVLIGTRSLRKLRVLKS